MHIKIRLGDISFQFLSEHDVSISERLRPFVISSEAPSDLTVKVSWNWNAVRLPDGAPLGSDLICDYYQNGAVRYCLVRGGIKGYVACTTYGPDFQDICCTFHEEPFINQFRSLDMVLRMLPMREILQYFDTLFFHAAQIRYRGKGILFTAPSGTGKSTQAELWRRYRGSDVLCSDRTLVRKVHSLWRGYGYPLDGSAPVSRNVVTETGCIILLEQGPENHLQQLQPSSAIPRLMEQLVLDTWSASARTKAIELLLQLIQDIPVFLFSCTPEEAAVLILEQELERKGVL